MKVAPECMEGDGDVRGCIAQRFIFQNEVAVDWHDTTKDRPVA